MEPAISRQDLFVERASRAGATVHRAVDPQAAAAETAELLVSRNTYSAGLASDLEDWGPLFAEALAAKGIEVAKASTAAEIASLPAGVTRHSLGIAETGSLLVAGNELTNRLLTMLPDQHVALVEASQLVDTLPEALELIADLIQARGRKQAHYLTLVTGPSRTGDIEQVLTVGVQGPKELHIVLVGAGTPEEGKGG